MSIARIQSALRKIVTENSRTPPTLQYKFLKIFFLENFE